MTFTEVFRKNWSAKWTVLFTDTHNNAFCISRLLSKWYSRSGPKSKCFWIRCVKTYYIGHCSTSGGLSNTAYQKLNLFLYSLYYPFPSLEGANLKLVGNKEVPATIHKNYYYYWYSALGPVWAETRVRSGDWYGSGTLHPGQVLRGSLPLLSPIYIYIYI